MSFAVLPRGYITGLTTSNDSDADHDIQIAPGEARDAGDLFSIRLINAITKQIDADWAAGDNAGGFPSGLTLSADTWYHVFVISDGATTDAGFDSSTTATNLLSDATGYSFYRRVGSVLTDGSSNITAFLQEGRFFLWMDPVSADVSSTITTTATSFTLTVPPLVVRVLANAAVSKGSSPTTARVSVYCPDQNDQTNTFQELRAGGSGATDLDSQEYIEVQTNSSGQIRAKTDSTGSGTLLEINTRGWMDFLGKE